MDTAGFSGARSEYTLSVATGSLVGSHSGIDGVDTLTDIESLQFSDQTISS